MPSENHMQIIQQLPHPPPGLQALLLRDRMTREHVLTFHLSDKGTVVTDEGYLISILITLYNFYQCLITPPIVAAPQLAINDDQSALIQVRSQPGLGKLNGRTRVNICTDEKHTLIAQLFSLIIRQPGQARFIGQLPDDIEQKVRLLFRL